MRGSSPARQRWIALWVAAGHAVLAIRRGAPIELTGFGGRRGSTRVRLSWQTASETNNAGFHIERNGAGGWKALGFVEGRGTTNAPQSYRFVDGRLPYAADSLTYHLRQVDLDGTETYADEVVVRLGAPDRLALTAPHPNPARGTGSSTALVPG